MSRGVSVVLTNRRAQMSCGDGSLFDELNDFFKYRKPGWEYTPSGRIYLAWQDNVKQGKADADEPQGWDGYLHLMHHGSIGTGVFLALREKLEKDLKIKFNVTDNRKAPDFEFSVWSTDLSKKVRDYQRQCFHAMFNASRTGGLILQATGAGKTFQTGIYLKALKGPALFLVDELTLLKQAINELREATGEDIGEIGNSVYKPKRITVATVQTIHRHRFDPAYVPWTKTLKAIIIDEVHLALNRRNFQTIAVIRPPVIFGLTATLELKKKNVAYRAYDLCGPVVFEYPLEMGVKEGFLSKGIAVAVKVTQDIKPERIKGSPRWAWVRERYKQQYQQLYEEIVVGGKKRNRVILDLIRIGYKQGKHIIVLLNRIKHLKNLSASLDGVPHRLVMGEVQADDRVETQAQFEKDKLRVILSSVVFKKGVNLKKINMIIDGAGMKSKNDAVQKYGRGVRLCDGKDGLIYFDVSDVGNKFEEAARSRHAALKRAGAPIFKISSEKGAKEILRLADAKLKKVVGL